MKVFEVTVVKKGCNSLVKIGVVVHSKFYSKEDQINITQSMSHEEVVFVSPSELAYCKFAYFIKGKEVLFSFVGLAASVHVRQKFFPELSIGKKFDLETIQSVFTLELTSTCLMEKDLEFISNIKEAINLEKKPYWHFNNEDMNGYDAEYVLLEVPNLTPFITRASYSSNFLQSSLISIEDINEIGKSLLGCEGQMKFRMQIKFDEQTLETILLTLYIQDIENGHMTRMDVMTVDVHEITI